MGTSRAVERRQLPDVVDTVLPTEIDGTNWGAERFGGICILPAS
jgi:hypothetical protein